MCSCVGVVKCEIMRLLAGRTGTLEPREVMGRTNKRKTIDVDEGRK